MSDKLIEKYSKFLNDLKTSGNDTASDMAKLLSRNILYYNTNSMSLEDAFKDSPEIDIADSDTADQDMKSYNYIREKLLTLLTQKESGV